MTITQKKNPKKEMKVCGYNACLALFKGRPKDIVRVYVSQAMVAKAGEILKYCAKQKLAYHIVEDDVLLKVSGSNHHEGIVFLAKMTVGRESFAHFAEKESASPGLILVLDQIENPHNVGAILRTAAHFAVKAIVCLIPDDERDDAGLRKLPPAALRTAEGAGEHVPLYYETLSTLIFVTKKHGIVLSATSVKGGMDLFSEGALTPCQAIVLGNESRGVSASVLKACQSKVFIPGTKVVESLNVSTAAAVIASEHWRQFQRKSPTSP